MIRLENMLMIGASGSNVGKTELACALLRRFGGSRRIIGVKVTAVASKDRSCPRGGQGCGVCSSMEGEYSVTEEADRGSGKDTEKLLAAGAAKVYWLRVMRTHLQEGLAALLETVDRDAVVICESNSLRQVVEPGLFLIVERTDGRGWKQSAEQVRQHADRIVRSDGSRFDLDLERIQLASDRWLLTEDATAIVLAGGRSRRMGADKSMLPIDGRPMIEHICQQLRGTFARVLISANDAEKFSFLGLDVIPDRAPGQGPLMAVASALEASDSELNLVVGCDVPWIKLPLVRRMLAEAGEADIVIPVTEDGKQQPLFAVYRRSVRRCMEEALASGARRLSDIHGLCKVRFIDLNDSDWLVNLNTMADYEQYVGCAVHTIPSPRPLDRCAQHTLQDALAIATDLALGRRVGTEHVDLLDAFHRILAQDVTCDTDVPAFRQSTRDGFACRRADLGNELMVVETVAAGSSPRKTIGPNECARIMTGAAIPQGADCVVMLEHVTPSGDVGIRCVSDSPEDNICPQGAHATAGETILQAGERIEAQHIALLAGVGCSRPLVSRRPTVGVIATGSELVEPDERPGPGQIRNSNSFQLSAMVLGASALPHNYGLVADDKEAIRAALHKAMAENDVVVLSGGISKGDCDFVRDILAENLMELVFDGVCIHSGRPIVFGASNEAFCFGLSGNPVSNFVMCELIVKPFLYAMAGHRFRPAVTRGELAEAVQRRKLDKDLWLPVAIAQDGRVHPVEGHRSMGIRTMCRADGLIHVPSGMAGFAKGTDVLVRRI